jgi:hypothetical protein
MMRRRPLSILAAVIVTLAALSGCGSVSGAGSDDAGTPSPRTAVTSTPARDNGDIPDPCTLLTSGDVAALTGRSVSTIDKDDAAPGAITRYCQWQQPSGQLAVFLTRTTEADFETTTTSGEPVDGVGEDAVALSGHLFVLHGTVQIDVYARGDSDAKNLEVAKKVARAIMPKIS